MGGPRAGSILLIGTLWMLWTSAGGSQVPGWFQVGVSLHVTAILLVAADRESECGMNKILRCAIGPAIVVAVLQFMIEFVFRSRHSAKRSSSR